MTRAGRADDSRQAMARFQQLRDNPASVTYSSSYLGQGRYAEALASTGLEAELIDRTTPAVGFVDATAAMAGSRELGVNASGAARLALGGRVDVSGGMAAALDRVASSLATGVTLADLDADGELDLVLVAGPTVLVRRQQGRQFDTGSAQGRARRRHHADRGGGRRLRQRRPCRSVRPRPPGEPPVSPGDRRLVPGCLARSGTARCGLAVADGRVRRRRSRRRSRSVPGWARRRRRADGGRRRRAVSAGLRAGAEPAPSQ